MLLPCKTGGIDILLNLNKKLCKQNITQLKNNSELFRKKLHVLYSYNLITRNCVTELFETIYSCFASKAEITKELGGYLKPHEFVSFIPFYAFYLFKQDFPQASVEIYSSYRKRQLSKLSKKEGVWSEMKESNTLTSSIYYPWEGDSTFLFFTDNVVLPRPLLGAANIIYAAVNMVGGVVWSPIDEGELLRRSVRGVVFSLPELAFFNIRKGTFPATANF